MTTQGLTAVSSTDVSVGGGYQAAGTLDALNTGATIIIVGLFIQLFCFGVFIIIAVSFHRSIHKCPTGRSSSGVPWKKHMMALYLGSLLIMVRSVFRAIEYLQGFDGYLLSHEAYLYVFDAALMFIFMVLFNWIHPAEITAIINNGGFGGGYKMDAVSPDHVRLNSIA